MAKMRYKGPKDEKKNNSLNGPAILASFGGRLPRHRPQHKLPRPLRYLDGAAAPLPRQRRPNPLCYLPQQLHIGPVQLIGLAHCTAPFRQQPLGDVPTIIG